MEFMGRVLGDTGYPGRVHNFASLTKAGILQINDLKLKAWGWN
jgi:hypothetical protein